MKCSKCQEEMIEGKTVKEDDGTEYKELKCPKCGKRLLDAKIPYNAFFGFDAVAE